MIKRPQEHGSARAQFVKTAEMKSEQGFTLIELLVVITIIGILAGIGLTQYSVIKKRGFDARAVSDLRNAMSAQEAYFATWEKFRDDLSDLDGFNNNSPSVVVVLDPEANNLNWKGFSYHPQGGKTFCYDSSSTEIVELEGLAQTCP